MREHRLKFGAILLIGGFLLSACATIVEGTDQSIKVNLSPDQANCIVTREGAQVGSLSRKNKYIKVSKSKNDLDVECRAPGYLTENLTVESSASGWGVVGCILIDLCITDYSTGALNKYPKQITIALVPETFNSKESRDNWYQSRRRSLQTFWDRRIKTKAAQCGGGGDEGDCEAELSELRKQKTAALEKIERRRQETKIAPSAQGKASAESRLKTIKDLYDRSVISREEYDRKRREIMSGI